MRWNVIDSLVCPHSGLVFSCLSGLKKLKLTIWYEGEIFMPPGSTIETYQDGILINDQYLPITVYNVTPYNASLWESLRTKAMCPGNNAGKAISCEYPLSCIIKKCPHGFSKNIN